MTQRKRKPRGRRDRRGASGARHPDSRPATEPEESLNTEVNGGKGDERVSPEFTRLAGGVVPILLVLPVLYLVFAVYLADLCGPFHWSSNLDPDAQYLQYGGRLADFAPPGNFQHPGIPVSLLAAAAIRTSWLVRGLSEGWEPITESIVAHGDSYMTAAAALNAALICALLFVAGWFIYRLTGSLVTAVGAQLGPLFLSRLMENFWGVNPEVGQVAAGLGVLIIVAPVALGPKARRMAEAPLMAYAAGCVIACGVATKFNFVTLTGLILVFPGFRQKLRAAAGLAATTAVLLVPLILEYERFRSWLSDRLARDTVVRATDPDMLAKIWGNTIKIFEREPSIGWLLGLYLVVWLVLLVCSGRSRNSEASVLRRVLWVGLLVMVGHLAFTSTHYVSRYVMPALVVTLVLNPVVLRAVSVVRLDRYARAGLAIVVLVAGGVSVWHMGAWFRGYRQGLERYRNHTEALAAKVAERPDCLTFGYHRSSLPTYSLFVGNQYAGGYFTAALEKVYPDDIRIQRWNGRFEDWSGVDHSARFERYVSEGGCVLVQGEAKYGHAVPGWQLHPVLMPKAASYEALYQLSLDALHPALIPAREAPRGALVLEAEGFSSGNVKALSQGPDTVVESVDSPAFAEYNWEVDSEHRAAIRIRYASAESRPLRVYLNGNLLMDVACHVPTGWDGASKQKWHDLGMYMLARGENALRLETDGRFPLVDKIAVQRVPDQG